MTIASSVNLRTLLNRGKVKITGEYSQHPDHIKLFGFEIKECKKAGLYKYTYKGELTLLDRLALLEFPELPGEVSGKTIFRPNTHKISFYYRPEDSRIIPPELIITDLYILEGKILT